MPTIDVVVRGGLGLGETYPAVFGVGEATAGDHLVGGLPGGSQDGVGRCDPAVHPGRLDEHRPAVDVTRGEDVPDVGAQVVIDGDHARLGADTGGVQGQVADVGGPADREEHGVRGELAGDRTAAVVDLDRVTVGAQTLDQRVCVHAHLLGAEGPAEFLRNARIGGRHQGRPGLEEADGDAQVVQDGGDLAARVGPADDGGPGRQGGQGRNVLVGQRQVRAGDREAAGVAADGQDDPVRRPAAPVAGGDGVRVGEGDRAEVLDQVNSMPPEMAGHVLLVVGVAGHPLAVGQHGGKVGHRRRAVEAEGGPGRPVARQAGGAGQRPHRRRAAVQAGAADLARFEQGDLGASSQA